MVTIDTGGSLRRKDVDAKHPEYNASAWEDTRLLYEGGLAIWEHRGRFLKQRPREDSTLYQYRLEHFCYENHLGTGLGWHEAEMFKQDPTIDIKLTGAKGEATDAPLPADQAAFWTRFLGDCTRHGTTFVDLFRVVFTDLLLYQCSWVLTDLPTRDESQKPGSLAEEKKAGLLDPYLTHVSPQSLINWDCDAQGNLTWAVIYAKVSTQSFGAGAGAGSLERWTYFDRQGYRVYEAPVKQEVTSDADQQPITMVREGYHALAAQGRLPLRRIQVPKGWWMGNRTYLPAIEHLNVSNALKWSLFMAALAMPVVITDDEMSDLTQSEAGFIKLSMGSDYKFAEPQGHSWEYLTRRAEALKEDIYRSMYLVAQARSNSATASAQSGVSKQQDMQPSHDVLAGIGDILRAGMQWVLGDVATARATVPGYERDARLLFDVRGFSFDEEVNQAQIETVTGLYALNIPSKTLEKELDKRVARAAMPDLNPSIHELICAEIDAAPSRAETARMRAEEDAARMSAQLEAAVLDDDDHEAPNIS